MPVAIGGEGESRLRPAQQRHPSVVGLGHHLGGGFDLTPEHVLHALPGAHQMAVVSQVGQKSEGGHEGGPGIDHRLQAGFVHERGMEDEIDSGFGTGQGAIG